MESFRNLLEPDRLPSMTKVWKPIVPVRKDRYLTPDELKSTVIQSHRIRILINELSNGDRQKRQELERTIREILNEIGLARSLPVIRWSGIFLNKVLTRICSGIHVNENSIARMKATMGNYPFLYLPSHRSYADFILMSYICFAYDLEIPGIAAGMDFYAMIGLGSLLRKTGAFFMRRSFSNDTLYWSVFREYIRSLVNVYHTGVEFFVEGTRSRSQKALPPKIGLLSMALEPLYLSEVSDIFIAPVGFSYEKPLEEQLFAYELIGVPKPKESTLGFFKALHILDTNYGNMYINFGEPISVHEYLKPDLDRMKHSQLPIHVQHLSKNELNGINKLALHIVSKQQQLIVLTVFNLVSIYFSYKLSKNETVSLDELVDGIQMLSKFLCALGAKTAIDDTDMKLKIIKSIEIHSSVLQLNKRNHYELYRSTEMAIADEIDERKQLKGHALNSNTIQTVLPIITLQLYCNPCMYWLVCPAFLLVATRKLGKSHQSKDAITMEWTKLRRIFSMEFIFECDQSHSPEFLLDYLIKQEIIRNDNQYYHVNTEHPLTKILLNSLVPFLFCYYQVTETIQTHFLTTEFTEKDILVQVQRRVEHALNAKNQFIHPSCLSLDSISLALNAFHSNNILDKAKSTKVVTYRANVESLLQLKMELYEYCTVMLLQSNLNSPNFVFAKL